MLVRQPAPAERTVRVRALPVWAAPAAAALFGVAWGGPVMVRMIDDTDFPFHLSTAAQFAADGRITMPHFLLQVLLGALYATGLFATIQQAGLVFFCGLYAAAAALLCWFIADGTRRRSVLVSALLLALAVLVAGPILPRGDEPALYLIGYFPPNVYHNPTMLMAKPLLILSLVCGVAAVTRTGRPRGLELLLMAAPLPLLSVAKPNYLACLVPAVAVVALWRRVRGAGVSWLRVGTICLAAALALGGTYAIYTFGRIGAESAVIVAPLHVIGLYAPVDAMAIAHRLLASLAFPLVVTALWPRAAMRDPALALGWLGAAAGIAISYLLAEAGPRLADGNFIWTGQMGVFVLFAAAAAFVRHHLTLAGQSSAMFVRALAVILVLMFHVESGLRHAMVKVEPGQWLAFWA